MINLPDKFDNLDKVSDRIHFNFKMFMHAYFVCFPHKEDLEALVALDVLCYTLNPMDPDIYDMGLKFERKYNHVIEKRNFARINPITN